MRAVIAAGADLIHFDVMDNHYVPNLTIGPLVCEALKPHVDVPIDVHLMVTPVDALVPEFADAGAAIISFHPEACDHVDRTIGLIHERGCKAGLVFNPATPLSCLDHVLDKLDLVLIMSVNPGFGGPVVHPEALHKLALARARIDAVAAAHRAGRSGSKSTAASRSTTSARPPRRAPTRSSPARRSSAAATMRKRSPRCVPR